MREKLFFLILLAFIVASEWAFALLVTALQLLLSIFIKTPNELGEMP